MLKQQGWRVVEHLHGCCWKGIHATLALQGFAGLLQVCDGGRCCYICIASPERSRHAISEAFMLALNPHLMRLPMDVKVQLTRSSTNARKDSGKDRGLTV